MREELIKNLRTEPMDSRKASLSILDLCVEAAEEIENLEGMLKESEAARAELGKHLAAAQKELHEAKSEIKKGVRERETLKRDLEAYKDTGLEPEGIIHLGEEWKAEHDALAAYRALGSIDGNSELMEAFSMAISALKQQELSRNSKVLSKNSKVVKSSNPLTMDELRLMNGAPVWLVGLESGNGWVRIDGMDSLVIRFSMFGDSETWCFRKAYYGVRVWAYRQKPEETV